MESQLTILSESLDRKLEVLQKIQEYNKRQEEVFSAEKVDIRQFDAAVEEKQHRSMKWYAWMTALKFCMKSWQKSWRATDSATQHRSKKCRPR